MRESANSSNQRARGAIGRARRVERRLGVALFEVLADDRRIAQRDLVVDVDRDSAQRAQRREAVVAEEGHDRVDLVCHALQVQTDQHLAHIRRKVAADDLHLVHLSTARPSRRY